MNIEKYTDRAKGFLQAAQTIALREGHQQFTPEHLLKALLDDNEGMAAGLIDRAGGQSRVALQLTDQALAKLPKGSPRRRGCLTELLDLCEGPLRSPLRALAALEPELEDVPDLAPRAVRLSAHTSGGSHRRLMRCKSQPSSPPRAPRSVRTTPGWITAKATSGWRRATSRMAAAPASLVEQ